MKRWYASVIFGLIAVSCVGTKQFTIHTRPEGAEVSINGVPQPGKTPVTLEVKQDKDLGIVAMKPGYESAAIVVPTQTSWWRSLLWTSSDPRAKYIEEDEVTLEMSKIPSAANYVPSAIPPYTGGGGRTSSVPDLRPMPSDLGAGVQ